MSLIRQVWLAVIVIALGAFAGSFAVSTLMARNYVEQQMRRQNIDTANSLALAMSQQSKDRASVELQIASLFDAGHYQSISLVDPFGKTVVERVQTRTDGDAPAWLARLLPIGAAPGRAQVMDGWKQFGVVNVVTHDKFAYQALWNGLVRLVGWFVLAALVSGLIGTLLVRAIRRPLGAVVEQAHAISERRFTSIPEPRTPELRLVARAMNDMVARLRQIFSEEAARLEALRHKVNHDDLTGLSRREYFLAHLREIVTSEHSAAVGCLVLVRLRDLDEINAKVGRARADALLKELGAVLWTSGEGRPGQRAGRMNGGEFAIVCPTCESARVAADDIVERLQWNLMPRWSAELPELYHVAAVRFRRGDDPARVLALGDRALAVAQSAGPNAAHAEEGEAAPPALAADEWRVLLGSAVEGGRLQLAFQPVLASGGQVLHQEAVMRFAPQPGAPLMAAGDFLPMATRMGLAAAIHLGFVRLALQRLQSEAGDVALLLSGETFAEPDFAESLRTLLSGQPSVRNRLWIEVPEWSAFRHFDAFHGFGAMLRALTCRVGIAHFGQRFAHGHKLTDLGLDYVRVHPSYVHAIDQNPDNREFLRGLCNVAHAIGIVVIAMDVETDAELAVLRELGFDGWARRTLSA